MGRARHRSCADVHLELTARYCTKTLTGHAEWVREVVPSDDGRLLVSVSNDQTARVWDFASGETKAELRGHEHVVECAAFAPSNSYAAIRELTGITANGAAAAAAGGAPGTASQPGKYAATGSRDKTVKLWDTASGQCLRTFVGHDNWVRALIFHPSGKFLLSASDDKTVKVWDLQTGRCVAAGSCNTNESADATGAQKRSTRTDTLSLVPHGVGRLSAGGHQQTARRRSRDGSTSWRRAASTTRSK